MQVIPEAADDHDSQSLIPVSHSLRLLLQSFHPLLLRADDVSLLPGSQMSQPCASENSASSTAALAYGLPYPRFGSNNHTVTSNGPYSYHGEFLFSQTTFAPSIIITSLGRAERFKSWMNDVPLMSWNGVGYDFNEVS